MDAKIVSGISVLVLAGIIVIVGLSVTFGVF